MGSRIRQNVKHLFQCFCEVVQPQPPDQDPWIIQKFPESYNDEEVLKNVPKFAYPCEFKNSVIQHFSFVLTSIDSKWTFGFCRHDPKTETALVLLSFLPWHESFYKLLDVIGEMVISSKAGAEQLWTFLDLVYNSTVPEQGARLQVPYNHGLSNFTCQAPNLHLLPSIPENRNLMEYYSAVDSSNMMIIFASMLYERRIVFTSSRLSRLSACVQAANAIIYPMNWQHIFIPVLPVSLIDYLLAPMPFLIGVPTNTLKQVRKSDMGDVVVLDADSNTVETPFNDLESLPLDVVNSLKRQLRNQVSLGDGVSRAFLRALVQLIGGYRDALKFHQGERITFNAEAFVESRPSSMQPFLRKMLQLQIFQQFVEERLDMLNAGLGFSDEFELEACNYSDKTSGKLKQQYKEWLSTVRKEGSAFLKSVKSKANPAVKSAVKSVKDRGKDVRTAYRGIRSKFRELQPPTQPSSAPNSPPERRRPATTAVASYRKDPNFQSRKLSVQEAKTRNYCPLSPSDVSGSSSPPDLGTSVFQLTPVDTDLMGDMHEVIFQKCPSVDDSTFDQSVPPVDRSLKPLRGLDQPLPLTSGSFDVPPTRLRAPISSPQSHAFSTTTKSQKVPQAYVSPNVLLQNSSDGFNLSHAALPSTSRLSQTPKVPHCPGDLIRLDSTPSYEDFDPLLSTNSSNICGSYGSGPSNINNSNNNILKLPDVKQPGLSNPLYPYFIPPGNTSFLYPQASVNTASGFSFVAPSYNQGTSNCNQGSLTSFEQRDSDLLKEYGLDFNSLSMQKRESSGGGSIPSNGSVLKPIVTDPFEEVERLAKDGHIHRKSTSQSSWTTFE